MLHFVVGCLVVVPILVITICIGAVVVHSRRKKMQSSKLHDWAEDKRRKFMVVHKCPEERAKKNF